MRVALRKRSFGEMVGLCFEVAVGHFGPLLVLTLLMNVPGAMLGTVQASATREDGALIVVAGLLGFAVSALTGPLLQAATIRIVASSFTGDPATLGTSLRLALRKMWPLLGYGMVTGVVVGVGLVLCILPGLIFLTWFFLGPAAIVLEDRGMTQAFGRSKALARGRTGEILGYVLITQIGFQLLALGIGTWLEGVMDERLAPWVGLPINGLLTMPMAVAPIVYYFNLRVEKEGFDLERLTSLIRGIGAADARPGA